jgi:AhpD family alkylhydroperoxidase
MSVASDVNPGLRLAPIDRPRGLLQRLMRLYFRFRFGKVMMPLRVLYPRIPGFTLGQLAFVRFAQRGLSLPREQSHLIAVRVSQQNDCEFCGDLEQAAALLAGHPAELFEALRDFEHSPLFDAATKAALHYADEVVATHGASDATFERLRQSFDERQIAEIVWLVAFTCYHNLIAKPLGFGSEGFCDLVARRARQPGLLPH